MNYNSLKEFFLNPNQGDESICREFENHIRRRVKHHLPSWDYYDVEDLVNDILFQCFRAAQKHNPEYPFENYINRIITNMIATAIRKKIEINSVEFNEEHHKVEVDQFEEIGADEIESEIMEIINGLKHSKYKEMIFLILQGLSNDDIAERLNITKVNATTRRSRAIAYLKKELEQAGIYIN